MLNFLKKEILFSLVLLLILTGCAKKPEAPQSPSVKIGTEKKGSDLIYTASFTCGLKNENDSVAFTGTSGTFEIKNNSGVTVLTVPFKSDVILPFETGMILEKIELTPEQAAPLFEMLSIKKEQIDSGEEAGNRLIDEKNIVMTKLDIEKKDIIELLRSKIK